MSLPARVAPGVPTGGQFAAAERGEAPGISLVDAGFPEPEEGANVFHACPARTGGHCVEHGSTTWSTHAGDLEVRACAEDSDGNVTSPVPEAEAQFYALYSADADGLWLALDDYDTRDEAEAVLRHTMVTDPGDIDAVRAATQIIAPDDHDSLEALSIAALPHLPEKRRAPLEARVRPGGGAIQWGGSARRRELALTLRAELIDATQDVPTQTRMKELRDDLDAARVAHTAVIIDRDLRRFDAAAFETTREAAADAQTALARADAIRERASLRRVLAGNPTVFDMWEIEERHATARDEARAATNEADRVRDAAGRSAKDMSWKIQETTDREVATRTELVRQRDALDGANAAWRAQTQREVAQ